MFTDIEMMCRYLFYISTFLTGIRFTGSFSSQFIVTNTYELDGAFYFSMTLSESYEKIGFPWIGLIKDLKQFPSVTLPACGLRPGTVQGTHQNQIWCNPVQLIIKT